GVDEDAIDGLRKSAVTRSLGAAKRFVVADPSDTRTLVLAGARGVGKSVAAAHVIGEWLRKNDVNSRPSGGKWFPPVVWCRASQVTRETDFGRVDADFLYGLERSHLLVLDDLGEDATVPGLAALTDILKIRHEKRRLTVITSNLWPDMLKTRYGESWFDRLKTAAIVPDLRGEKSLRKARHEARNELHDSYLSAILRQPPR